MAKQTEQRIVTLQVTITMPKGHAIADRTYAEVLTVKSTDKEIKVLGAQEMEETGN